MAEVYLARATGADGFEKVVALKLVLPHLSEDERFIRMFRSEAKLAAQLDHPNIAQVNDLGMADGEYFIAMEYIHGKTVRALLGDAIERGGMPLEAALAIVDGTCAGLHYAHERRSPTGEPLRIVHRDISPSNVMVRFDGAVKVVDFGIAKAATATQATRTGTLKGKGGYMSPEQCRGQALDRRSDVFALGILLYEATTGRRLFFGDNDFAVMNKIVDGNFAPPSAVKEDYPDALEAIVLEALATDPNDRFPTAQALRRALEEFAVSHHLIPSTERLADFMEAVYGRPELPAVNLPSPTDPLSSVTTQVTLAPHRRRPALWLGAAVVVLGIGGALYAASREPAPSSNAAVSATRTPASADAEPEPSDEPPAEAPSPAGATESEPLLDASSDGDEPDPVESATPPAEKPTRGKAKRKKRRTPSKKRSTSEGRSDPDSFFPRSMK